MTEARQQAYANAHRDRLWQARIVADAVAEGIAPRPADVARYRHAIEVEGITWRALNQPVKEQVS